jgi:acetylornithine deacetylase/succinyl-diaminopimelate desuccinylase-like protein
MKLRTLISLCLLSAPALVAAQTGTRLSEDKAAAETVSFLKDLIRIDTQDPPGNESKVAEYIAKVFQREGIAYEILETVPGRASIVARLKGDGSRKPVLLMAHEDVVPVDRAHWTEDPFAAIEKDGVIYGRGASDDKSPLAGHIETMLQLRRGGKKLKRDVIFLAEASEENGSAAGMKTIVDRYWDKIACEFALNEGGAAESKEGKVLYMGIATGEKMPRGVVLKATGSSGHGSVPVEDNAVVHLAAAVAKLGTWQSPMRLNDTTREFFSRLAAISPPDQAALFRSLENDSTQQALQQRMPQFYSMLHTSVVPTILKAGFKSNVIPPDAEGTLDIRALPDEDMESFYQAMDKVIADPSVKIIRPDLTHSMPPAPASSLHTAMFDAFEHAQKKLLPDSITVPVLNTGATDSSHLRVKGVQAYGVRIPRTFSENTAVHGNDERIERRYVAFYQRFVETAVLEVCE